MDIGIPHERRNDEYRVGLTPAGVELLTAGGHTCYVESGAGLGAGFSDQDYHQAGGHIVYSGEEAFMRADLVIKVARPTVEEFDWMREGQTVMGFLHLASARRDKVQALLSKNVTAIEAPGHYVVDFSGEFKAACSGHGGEDRKPWGNKSIVSSVPHPSPDEVERQKNLRGSIVRNTLAEAVPR